MPDLVAQLDEQKRKVDFDSFDITVKELTSMVSDKMIDIAPDYQRQFRWDDRRQSAFIESILLGIPIPTLFMAANRDGTWELIDGVQRLSTIVHFLGTPELQHVIHADQPLVLTGLEKLTAFNGNTFASLPQAVQRQLQLRPLKITTISDKSDMHVRFDLFERLNTGGVLLTPQEIRACIYQGKFNEFLREMAATPKFLRLVKLSREDRKNGTPEELALRFLAFSDRYKEFKHSVTEFLNDYMESGSKDANYPFKEKREAFQRVCVTLAKVLPNGIVRPTTHRTPVNLFEGITVGCWLALRENGDFTTAGINRWIDDAELREATGAGSNSQKMVRQRIEFCRDKFLGR